MAKLAVIQTNGDDMWKVPLFRLNYDNREIYSSSQVIKSGWLTMGEQVEAFEAAFAAYLGPPDVFCTAVSSGTAALHLALLASGIGPGHEVILPALTFVADANVVEISGAKPILADCASLDNWNVSVATLANRITPRTRAVLVVHYAGYPCAMAAIRDLCDRHKLALIEDVAHAPGARIDGQACGTFGDIACFSFFSNKNLSIGEGGMLATRDPALHRQLRYLRSHGMTTLTLDRHQGRAVSYDVVRPGLNYRMDEIHAAIGRVQLDKLPAGNQRRAELTALYRRLLAGTGVAIPFADLAGVEPSFHILPVLLPEGADRLGVIAGLKACGVQSSIHYPPFWAFSAYRDRFSPDDAPLAAAILPRQLTLPLYPTMAEADVEYVVASLLDALR